MVKLPGLAENAPKSFKKLMKKDPSIAQYIKCQIEKMENGEEENCRNLQSTHLILVKIVNTLCVDVWR